MNLYDLSLQLSGFIMLFMGTVFSLSHFVAFGVWKLSNQYEYTDVAQTYFYEASGYIYRKCYLVMWNFGAKKERTEIQIIKNIPKEENFFMYWILFWGIFWFSVTSLMFWDSVKNTLAESNTNYYTAIFLCVTFYVQQILRNCILLFNFKHKLKIKQKSVKDKYVK